MNKQERSAVVFLDLRKAFDTVDHSILLQKLRHYGIDDASRGWFQNYLDSRLQQTRANDMTSSLQEVGMGVPQWSVLGPLLFIVYMNDVINSITHSSTFLYADDLAIVISGKDPERVKSLLQLDLDSVSRWCSDNKLTINNDKTHVLWVFSPRSIPDLSNCDLTIDGRVLTVVPVFNYLGLNIDRHLNVACQLKKQIRLLRMRLPQLGRLRRRTDVNTAVQVYKHMVRPISDYCAFMADSGPVWAALKLQTLQNDCLRACELIHYAPDVHVHDLHLRNKVSYLEVTRRKQLLTHMHRLSLSPDMVVEPTRVLRNNSSKNLKVPRVKKAIFAKSPLHRGELLWRDLDDEVQHLTDKKAFLKAI